MVSPVLPTSPSPRYLCLCAFRVSVRHTRNHPSHHSEDTTAAVGFSSFITTFPPANNEPCPSSIPYSKAHDHLQPLEILASTRYCILQFCPSLPVKQRRKQRPTRYTPHTLALPVFTASYRALFILLTTVILLPCTHCFLYPHIMLSAAVRQA